MSQNKRYKSDDFVTSFTKLALTEAHASVCEDNYDRHILEQAKHFTLRNSPEIALDADTLSHYHMTIQNAHDATEYSSIYIFQEDDTKIIVESAHSDQLVIKAYERGQPRRLSPEGEDHIRSYLSKKSFIHVATQEDALAGLEITQSSNHDESAIEDATAIVEIIPEENRNIGLEISSICLRMCHSYNIESVQIGQDELDALQVNFPGILDGLEVPSFKSACLESYFNILSRNQSFIDDLDETVFKLGVAGGKAESQVKLEMSERALQLFKNELNTLSGKPLKKSRAEKLMAFGEFVGKKALAAATHFAESRALAVEILEHEGVKTPKPQRDRELIQLYSDFMDWFER